MGKNLDKNISKILNGIYSQKFLHHTKQPATDALKTTLKRVIQKTEEATDDLIGNTIPDKITRISKNSKQNNSVTIEHDKEISKERYISPEERHKSIGDLRLI